MAAKTVSRAGKVSARERARAAKAVLDAERAERERKIEDAATSFYAAVDERDEAQAQSNAAEERMGQAVADLTELGEPGDRIATLCGIEASEVRRLVKAHRHANSTDKPTDDKASTPDGTATPVEPDTGADTVSAA